MIITKADLTQRIHKETLLANIRSEEKNVQSLLQWSQLAEQPLGWRATWLLRQVLSKQDPRIAPHISNVLEAFPSYNHSQKREWLKLLEHQSVPENAEGKLFDLCLTEWERMSNHAALRASAANIMFQLAKKYPELISEMSHLMEPQYIDDLTPGIRKGVISRWTALHQASN